MTFTSESREQELYAKHDRELDEINRQFDEGEVNLAEVVKLARRHAKEEQQVDTRTLAAKTRVATTLIIAGALVLCVWIVMYMSPYQTCVRQMLLYGDDRDDAALACAHWLNGK